MLLLLYYVFANIKYVYIKKNEFVKNDKFSNFIVKTLNKNTYINLILI